jgi:cytochrome c
MRNTYLVLGAVIMASATTAHAQPLSGDAKQGARLFANCAACHSLVANKNMTGPSLAGVWGRKAGSLMSFDRYSPALKASKVTWDAKTLDTWLKDPAAFIPGNSMTFRGIDDPKVRTDLVAFLKDAGTGRMPAAADSSGGMMGMMSGLKDLKKVGPERRVRAIRLCRDSYFVTKADGKVAVFWEPNLRFETDSSALGPPFGVPAIMPAGMMGDRASIIFAAPEEISKAIKQQC